MVFIFIFIYQSFIVKGLWYALISLFFIYFIYQSYCQRSVVCTYFPFIQSQKEICS